MHLLRRVPPRRGAELPKFGDSVDIAKSDIAALRLKEGIDTVPTAVLMKNGEEIGRICGYWGREGFFKMLAHIRSAAE